MHRCKKVLVDKDMPPTSYQRSRQRVERFNIFFLGVGRGAEKSVNNNCMYSEVNHYVDVYVEAFMNNIMFSLLNFLNTASFISLLTFHFWRGGGSLNAQSSPLHTVVILSPLWVPLFLRVCLQLFFSV